MSETQSTQHTPGPWRWEVYPNCRAVELFGGNHKYNRTVLSPVIFGTDGITFLLCETDQNKPDILHKLSLRTDWLHPAPGRKHREHWMQTVNHPDLLLIQAAPDMLQALRRSALVLAAVCEKHPEIGADEVYEEVSRAIGEAVFGKKES